MMSYTTAAEAAASFQKFLIDTLSRARGVNPEFIKIDNAQSISIVLSETSRQLQQKSKPKEAEALDQVREKVFESLSFGGLGLADDDIPTSDQYKEILFLCEAWLESVKSREKSNDYLNTNTAREHGTKPMTLAQKIFTQHALGSIDARRVLALGDVVRVGVDWIIASELSWAGMARTYEELGSPGIWRNDRFWIAGQLPKYKTNIVSTITF